MDFDFINIVNFMIILICITSVISGFVCVYRNFRNNIGYDLIDSIVAKSFKYIGKLSVIQYLCFQKYKIWRFYRIPDFK